MTRNLFVFAAIISLLFGLPLIFDSQFLANTFLVDPTVTAGAKTTFRGYGIVLTSLAIGLFIARNSAPSTAKGGWLITIVISTAFIAINTVYAITNGVSNNKGWIIVVICAIEAIWGIVLLSKKEG